MEPIEIILRVIVNVDGTVTRTAEVVNPTVKMDGKPTPPKPVVVKSVIAQCLRYVIKVGKKEANTCHGCTIGCNLKPIFKGAPIEIKERASVN